MVINKVSFFTVHLPLNMPPHDASLCTVMVPVLKSSEQDDLIPRNSFTRSHSAVLSPFPNIQTQLVNPDARVIALTQRLQGFLPLAVGSRDVFGVKLQQDVSSNGLLEEIGK